MRPGHKEINLFVGVLGAILLLGLLLLSGCQSRQPPGGDLWTQCQIVEC